MHGKLFVKRSLNMCTNWILPFIAGLFIGQEFKEAPKVRPYLESGVRKLIEVTREIYDKGQSEANRDVGDRVDPVKKSWWSKQE